MLAAPFYRQQLLTASVGESTHQLMTVLEADGRQLTLVGLTPSGVRLFLVRYDQQGSPPASSARCSPPACRR